MNLRGAVDIPRVIVNFSSQSRPIAVARLFRGEGLDASRRKPPPLKRRATAIDAARLGCQQSQIASGLKEALQAGATNAVKLTGRPDGYFGNEAIKILMPK